MKNQIQQLSIITFFILILSMVNSGCKNKDCHKTGECLPEYYRIKINDKVKSYIWSLPGSYWIYKNTVTGDLNTQTCVGFYFDSLTTKGTLAYSKQITITYDIIGRTIKGSFDNHYYTDETNRNTPDSKYFNNGATILSRDIINELGTVYPFYYPFQIGTGFGDGVSTSTYFGVDDTLVLQGKTYHKVARFNIDIDVIWYPNAKYVNTIYYWAKDVGLIKRENKTENYAWELIEYNIIK